MASQALFLATTAIAVSSTVLFLAFNKQDHPPKQTTLRSCLYSEERKKERKKKKVHFAETVKETSSSNGEDYRKEHSKKDDKICSRNQIPENRIALYNGILKDRVHRMECSY